MIDGETLNLVHIHVNDTSDEAAFDVAYVHDQENIQAFKEFKTDSYGRPLKYKILVKDCKVWKVLYNDESSVKEIDELPF